MIMIPADHAKLVFDEIRGVGSALRTLGECGVKEHPAFTELVDRMAALKTQLLAAQSVTALTMHLFPKEIANALRAFDSPDQ